MYETESLIAHDSRASIRQLASWTTYILGIISYGLLFGVWQTEAVPGDVYLAGVLLAAVCTMPLAIWAARGSRGLPMFELICVAYLFSYSVPLYLQPNGIILKSKLHRFEWEDTYLALLQVTIGVVAMIAAYSITQASRMAKSVPRINLLLTGKAGAAYPAMAVAIGVGTMALQATGLLPESSGGWGAFLRLLTGQYYIGVGLLSYLAYGTAPRAEVWRLVLYLSVAIGSILGLCTGMIENALLPLVIVFITRWEISRRLPLLWLAIGLPLFFIISASKMDYRSVAWRDQGNGGVLNRISLWLEATSAHVAPLSGNDAGDETQSAVNKIAHRLDLIHIFTYVTRCTPDDVPYLGGRTYAYLLYGLVPRILWPGKPVAEANDDLAVSYRLIDRRVDQTTSIGVGHVSEAYANFGTLGIILVMALEGLVFGLIGHLLDGPESQGGKAIYLSVLVFYLNGIGASTALLFMGTFWGIVANVFLMRLLASGRPAATGRQKLPSVLPAGQPRQVH